MATLVETVRTARSHNIRGPLRTSQEFWGLFLAEDYSVSAWAFDSAVSMEARQFIKTLAGKAPFIESLFADAEASGAAEVRFDGSVGRGIALAWLREWPVLSLGMDPWRVDPLPVICSVVEDMVNKATSGCSGCSWHEQTLTAATTRVK